MCFMRRIILFLGAEGIVGITEHEALHVAMVLEGLVCDEGAQGGVMVFLGHARAGMGFFNKRGHLRGVEALGAEHLTADFWL